MTANLKEAQRAKIRETLPSWLNPSICAIPPTGKTVNLTEGQSHYKRVPEKPKGTQDGVATEMAQKIQSVHGPRHASAAKVIYHIARAHL